MREYIKRKALYYAGLIVIRYRHRRVRGRGVLYSAAWAMLDLNDLFWYELVYGRLGT